MRTVGPLFASVALVLAGTLLSTGASASSLSSMPTKDPPSSPTPPPPACDVTLPPPLRVSNTALIEGAEAATPDGGTLCFPAGATYVSEGTWKIADRENLTVEGNGATLRATSLVGDLDPGVRTDGREHVLVDDGSDVAIVGLNVVSANTGCSYDPRYEFEPGFAVRGAENVTLQGVTVSAVGGDGVSIGEHHDSTGSPVERATDVRILDSAFTCIGRQGLSVTDADGFEVARSSFDDIARTAVDFEPVNASAIVENGHIHHSTFTDFANYWVGGSGRAGNVQRNIVLEFNAATRLLAKVGTPDGLIDRTDWIFRSNVGSLTIPEDGGPRRSAFVLLEAARVLIEGNIQAFGPESGTTGVDAVESSHVVVTGNDFAGVDVVCLGC
jgi:hypothetical protein